MTKLDVLLKCITLLYRENVLATLDNTPVDSSKDLIKTIIGQINSDGRKLIGGESAIISELIALIQDLIKNVGLEDKTTLLQSLSLILKDNISTYNVIEKAIETEMEIPGLKRSISSLRNNLNNCYKELEIKNVITKAAYQLKLGNITEDIGEYTNKLIANLEALANTTKGKDPGIVDEIDLNEANEDETYVNLKKHTKDTERLKTGWLELNEMLGGGFRYSECAVNMALQHNFKSGFIRSIFAQLCMYNKPTLKDKNKKPLAVFISFEDDTDIIIEFFYIYLYYSVNNTLPNISEVSFKEMGMYIKNSLSKTGFNIKLLRVNPNDWTYMHLTNKLLSFEANGYELKIVAIDYLSKLPTAGCNKNGPIGTDIRDLFDKTRNFCSARNTLLLVCHQLSTEAKQLIRNGVEAKEFVKEIAGKGYTEGSRQIDQVVDLELYQHIAKIGKKFYLTIQRGKRRFPEIIPEDKKYFMLPFPPQELKVPCIPPNLKIKEDCSLEYVGFSYSKEDSISNLNKDNDTFDF